MWIAEDSDGKQYLFNNRPFVVKGAGPTENQYLFMDASSIPGGIPVETSFTLRSNPQQISLEIKEMS